jgi:hypothetical protein
MGDVRFVSCTPFSEVRQASGESMISQNMMSQLRVSQRSRYENVRFEASNFIRTLIQLSSNLPKFLNIPFMDI